MLTLIQSQAAGLAALGARLSGVTLAAPLDGAAQAVLRITWTLTGADPLRAPKGVTGMVQAPTQEGRTLLPPGRLSDLDAQFLAAAWGLGAWDVQRTERAPLPPGADPLMPGHGLVSLLVAPYRMTGIPAEEAPIEVAPWARACARHGWVTWYCRPMWLAPEIRQRAWMAKDATLLQDGTRPPRAWGSREPLGIGTDHQTIIRLGSSQGARR
jgi:hypothetical protein